MEYIYVIIAFCQKQTYQNSCISQSKHFRDAFSDDEIHHLRKLGAKALLSVVSWSYKNADSVLEAAYASAMLTFTIAYACHLPEDKTADKDLLSSVHRSVVPFT